MAFSQKDASSSAPLYPGGDAELMKDIQTHLVYPKAEADAKIGGKVMVAFIVEPDGSVSNVRVEKGVADHPALGEAAVKAVGQLKPFTPAHKEGKASRYAMALPVIFAMD